MHFLKKSVSASLCALMLLSFFAACNSEELPDDDPDSNIVDSSNDPANPDKPTPTVGDSKERNDDIQNSLTESNNINKEILAWLQIPNTNIDLPVAHRPTDRDNSYYMGKTVDNQDSKDGTLFADFRCIFDNDMLSNNTVIYGHNWQNISNTPRKGNTGTVGDTMFAQLMSYHYLDFAQENPYIYFSTKDNDMVWKIFAAFYTDIDFNYIEPNPISSELIEIADEAKSRSEHNYDVDVKEGDKILTLSTCTRRFADIGNQQRFVVMARLLRDGETEEDSVKIEANPTPVRPKGVE